jgi:hypothetical protein
MTPLDHILDKTAVAIDTRQVAESSTLTASSCGPMAKHKLLVRLSKAMGCG